MLVAVGHGGEDAVMLLPVRQIHHKLVDVGKIRVPQVQGLQLAEHGAAVHAVAVNHRHRVAESIVVVSRLGKEGAVGRRPAVNVPLEIVLIVRGVLHHRVADVGARDGQPGVDVAAFPLPVGKVNGAHIGRLRLCLRRLLPGHHRRAHRHLHRFAALGDGPVQQPQAGQAAHHRQRPPYPTLHAVHSSQ